MSRSRLTRLSRRHLLTGAALLSTAALPGCSWFDDLFETHKVPLTGRREQVLPTLYGLQVDPADHRPIILPKPVQNAAWAQSGETPTHVMGQPRGGRPAALLAPLDRRGRRATGARSPLRP